jgi:hypothetical protein
MFNDIFTALGVNLLRLSVDGEGIHRNRNFIPLFSELRYSAGAPSPSSTAENAIKKGKKTSVFYQGLQAGKRNAS